MLFFSGPQQKPPPGILDESVLSSTAWGFNLQFVEIGHYFEILSQMNLFLRFCGLFSWQTIFRSFLAAKTFPKTAAWILDDPHARTPLYSIRLSLFSGIIRQKIQLDLPRMFLHQTLDRILRFVRAVGPHLRILRAQGADPYGVSRVSRPHTSLDAGIAVPDQLMAFFFTYSVPMARLLDLGLRFYLDFVRTGQRWCDKWVMKKKVPFGTWYR